ncbi:p53 and DNA damage-regulated protein 1 [Orchesella cincta]|uniref:p53 and DNA damage-regulated protein 1 n=1 Tax=Orchesella cincta TaxID=48709 RepID=A0A1D2N3I5_ORCCI|nr:p53 and DNA damage-regulated protein 1 [Orchesella cincta]
MDTTKIVTCLTDLEEVAEDILTDRRTIIDLDRTRNGNREALRHLQKQGDKKSWIVMGNTFFKLETESVEDILKKDQEKLDKEINDLRDNLKKKMDKIKDLEGKPALKGFNLKPLNRDEMSAIYKTIGK